MKQKNGFTLIESLIVLSVVSILLMIAVPVAVNQLESYQERAFLHLLEHDLLYAQSLAMLAEDKIDISFHRNHYNIRHSGKPISSRPIPKGYLIDAGTMPNPISFNINGSIRKPGTMHIVTKKRQYQLVFPLGKGRARFEKE